MFHFIRIVFLFFIFPLSTNLIAASTQKDIKILVEHKPASDAWKVTYKLPHPVQLAEFARDTNLFRHTNWSLKDSNMLIVKENNKEYIKHRQNKLFQTVEINIPSFYENLQKDYEFHFKYTDGSILFYTGHLQIHSLDSKSEYKTELLFFPRKNESIVLMGEKYKKGEPVRWLDEGVGTEVYFGNISPIQTKWMTAVIDPGLPSWSLKAVNNYLPKITDYYHKELGIDLDFKPTIYLSYNLGKKKAMNNGGGILGKVMQLSLDGQGWNKESKETLNYLIGLIAHESAHLWNSSGLSRASEQAWIHEGGAEALKYRAMLNLGVLTKAEVNERYQDDLERCKKGLSGIALNESGKKRRFSNYYTCGATIFWMIEKELVNHGVSLNSFIGQFLRAAKTNNSSYDQELFFRILKKMGVRNDFITQLTLLTSQPQKDLNLFFKSSLKL